MKTVVVVDNDHSVRNILVRGLQRLDCSIQSFSNGQDALTFLNKHAAGVVDLVITDLQLPDGTSGVTLVREFQKMNPSAPALIISTDEWDGGEIPVLEKPFGIAEFLEKVEELLRVRG